jgi:hypothetical protein
LRQRRSRAFLDELSRARRFFEQYLSAPALEGRAPSGSWRRPTGARIYLAWDILLLGYPREARGRAEVAIADAERTGEPFSIALRVGNALIVFELLRDRGRLLDLTERLHAVAQAVYLPRWAARADWFRTFLMIDEGDVSHAIPHLQANIETWLAARPAADHATACSTIATEHFLTP